MKDTTFDNLYTDAVTYAQEHGYANITDIQRALRISFTLAASIVDRLKEEGIVDQHYVTMAVEGREKRVLPALPYAASPKTIPVRQVFSGPAIGTLTLFDPEYVAGLLDSTGVVLAPAFIRREDGSVAMTEISLVPASHVVPPGERCITCGQTLTAGGFCLNPRCSGPYRAG